MSRRSSRRDFLAAGATACAMGLAGCTGDSGSPGGDAEGNGSTEGATGSGGTTAGTDVERSGPGTWPTGHRTAARTGYTSGTAPTDGVAERWHFDSDDRFDAAPAVVDGTVYALNGDGVLSARAVEDGAEQWNAHVGDGVGSVTVSDGTVVIDDHGLVGLDAASGEELWATDGVSAAAGGVLVADLPLDGSDGETRSIVGVRDRSEVVAVDAADRSEAWTFATTGRVRRAPAYADGTVFVASSSVLYAIDAANGRKQWHYEASDPIGGAPAVVDGTVYVGDQSGTVAAVTAADGEVEWEQSLNGGVYGSPAVGNGLVYVGTWGEQLHALDAGSGEVQWTFDTDGQIDAGPAVAGEAVYVPSRDGHLYAVDAANGDFLWRFAAGDAVRTSPAIVAGTVYVGDASGRFYALGSGSETGSDPNELGELTVDQSWPSPQYDRANTGSVDRSGPVESAEERWDTVLPGSGGDPLVVDGSVLVTAGDGELHSYDAATGEREWRFSHDYLSDTVVLGDGQVYSWVDYTVYAYDLASRSATWSTELDEVLVSPIATDGRVYVANAPYTTQSDGRLAALDAASGEKRWEIDLPKEPTTGTAFADDALYYGTEDGVLAVDTAERATAWEGATDAEVVAPPTVVDDAVFVPDDGGVLSRFDRETGERQWTAEFESTYHSACAVADGTVVVNTKGAVYAFDAADGAQQWTYSTEEDGTQIRPVVGDGVVYTTTGDYRFRAIDLESGDVRWHASPSGVGSFGSPAIVNGLVVATYENELLAYQEADG